MTDSPTAGGGRSPESARPRWLQARWHGPCALVEGATSQHRPDIRAARSPTRHPSFTSVVGVSELRSVVLVCALLLAMALTAGLGARHRAGALALAAVSLVWLLVDSGFEGVVLVDVTATNGLTTSDLVGVGGLAVALGQWLRLTVRRR